ncbi:MAG: preprotein translocase subunit SecG [Pseudomonadota bacterium]
MEQIILIVHLITALAIIGLIMLQQGKGADMGASFGAGASQTLFGSDGSGNVLTKATGWLVALFFATSFGLAMVANQKSGVVDDLGLDIPVQTQSVTPAVESQPAAPAMDDDLPSVDGDVPSIGGDNGNRGDDLPTLD